MNILITQEDFERFLPAGCSASEEVFAKVQPSVGRHLAIVRRTMLGPEGEAMVGDEETDGNLLLREELSGYVCLSAFLAVLRQLDLVLTPTGFGVVSTQEVSPASKMRVDALEGQLRTETLKAECRLLDALRSDQWGMTKEAQRWLPTLYTPFDLFYFSPDQASLSYQDWQKAQPMVERADLLLRRKIGERQMNRVAEAFRTGHDDDYIQLIARIRRFTRAVMADGEHAAMAGEMPYVVQLLESDLEKYKEWAGSPERKAHHHEHFQNTKDSTAYIFG